MADVTLITSISNLATRVGQEANTLHAKIGELTELKTDVKSSTVDALNELYDALSDFSSAIINDDESSTSTTYSSDKINDAIKVASEALKDELLDGAGEAYDTLKELADLIVENQDAIKALEALAAGHVKYDEEQDLTEEQKETARNNIGAMAAGTIEEMIEADLEPYAKKEEDLQPVAEAAEAAQEAADAAQADVDELKENIGDFSDVDFVALFEAALAGDDGDDGGDTEPDDQNP